MGTLTKKLTTAEWAELRTLEGIIERGEQTFREVGQAVQTVRDKRLYREKYDTFEAYCQGRWGWKRARAYQLIEAAAVVKSLPPKMSTIVDNEAQARELAKVPAESRAAVLESVKSSGQPVTAKAIAEAAPKAKPAPQVHEVDETGQVIPASVLDRWHEYTALGSRLERELSRIKCEVEQFIEGRPVEVTNRLVASLTQARIDVLLLVPHAVCPKCTEHNRADCRFCKGAGFVSKFRYEHHVTEKEKAMRGAK